MAKTTVPGLYIADGAITAAKLSSTLDLSGVTLTVATASTGDNDTTVASTAFVQQEIAALVDSSPSALNTLNELAAAIGDDANFSTTVTNSIATKLALAGGTMTGDLIINTTGSIQIPVGTTAQRPTAAQGQLRFNTTTSKPEIYNGSAWADVGGGVESVNSATGVVTLDTDDISEGSTNLYFTNARADARIAAATTDDLSEGSTNLYFTTARANSAIDGRLSGSTGVTVSNGAISIGQDVATSTSPTFQNLTLSGTDSIKVPSGTTAQRSGSPANGMLRYNSSTNEFEGYADSAWGAIGGDTTSSVDLYTVTGDGTSDTYDTGKNPQSENNTWVFIGGVYQPKSTYSYSGTEITLSENLPNGEDLEVITGTVSTYNPTDAILGQFNTTTSNTASYDTSLTTENENNVFVFIDGVYQPKSSYTYSGSTLTLDATPTSGMSLEVLVTRSMNAATVTTGFLADDAVTTAKILNANVTADKLASSLDLTGKTVTVATASAGDNDTSVASTAFVRQEITSLVDSAPAAMDTLNELAAALGDDANFSTTVNASIAAKLPLAGGTLTGDLNFGDNDKAVFGAGSDLQIFSDGTDSFVQDTGTGILRLKSNGSKILMETAGGETLAEFINNGNTVLYSNNVERLRTNGSGINVTGTVTNDGLIVDGNNDIQINRDGVSTAKIFWNRSGTTDAFLEVDSGENLTLAVDEAQLGSRLLLLRNNQTNVVSVSSSGIDVTGTVTADGLTVDGTIKLDGNYPTGTDNVALGNTALDSITSGNNNTAIGSASLTANTTGVDNVAVGKDALKATGAGTDGSYNVAVGVGSLEANTQGQFNVGIGRRALYQNTTADENTAVGYLTLYSNTTGGGNTALGVSALQANTTASNNTAVGNRALTANTTGDENVAVGRNALMANTTGIRNTAVGHGVLNSCTTGTYNTGVGRAVMDDLTTGTENTAMGNFALGETTTGNYNSAFGGSAMADNITGERNTAIGHLALADNTTATNNTAVGSQAMRLNTTGADNTAVGRNSLDANTTGHSNTAIGEASLTSNTTGIRNTSIGKDSMVFNTTGNENVAVGRRALNANSTAAGNTAVGDNAGASLTTGGINVAIGHSALDASTNGQGNVAIGYLAASTMNGSNGKWNVAIGYNAMRDTDARFQNVAVGQNALTKNLAHGNTAVGSKCLEDNTHGDGNNGQGYFCLSSCTTGDNNVAMGTSAGTSITTGSHNTIIGTGAGTTLTTGSQCILIGREANVSSAGNSELVIGNTVSGQGNNTGKIYPPGGGGIYQATNGTSFLQTSDKRIKKNIVDNNEGLNKLKDIQVRNFEYRTEDEVTELPSHLAVKKEGIQLGVIAQEIETILPEIITIESSGVKTVNPDNITWYLVNAVKELSSQVDELKEELKVLKGE